MKASWWTSCASCSLPEHMQRQPQHALVVPPHQRVERRPLALLRLADQLVVFAPLLRTRLHLRRRQLAAPVPVWAAAFAIAGKDSTAATSPRTDASRERTLTAIRPPDTHSRLRQLPAGDQSHRLQHSSSVSTPESENHVTPIDLNPQKR